MAAEARAMLDALMGQDRNNNIVAPASNENDTDWDSLRKKKSCYDRDVCPLYCAWGVDVYELFTNTKSDLGPNPYQVRDDAREEYLSLPEHEKDRLGFERMLHQKLGSLVRDCDRIVNRNKEKLRQEIVKAARARGTNQNRIDPVTDISDDMIRDAAGIMADLEIREEEVKEMLQKIMELDEDWQGLWKELQGLEKKSEAANEGAPDEQDDPNVETKIKEIKSKVYALSAEQQKVIGNIANLTNTVIVPLRDQLGNITKQLYYVKTELSADKTVCEVSGNFMSFRDAEERIAAHYAGKQYVGWKMVRDKFKELDQKARNWRPTHDGPPRGPPPGYGRDGGGYGGPPPGRGRNYARGYGGRDGGGYRRDDRSRSRDDRWERDRGYGGGGPHGGGYRRNNDRRGWR